MRHCDGESDWRGAQGERRAAGGEEGVEEGVEDGGCSHCLRGCEARDSTRTHALYKGSSPSFVLDDPTYLLSVPDDPEVLCRRHGDLSLLERGEFHRARLERRLKRGHGLWW